MTVVSFFKRASQVFHGYSTYSKLLVLFTVSGGGVAAYSESQSEVGTPAAEVNQDERKKKRVVVLGTGWAGISFLKNLDVSSYDVQVVSPRNYFAFTPLLPSVTCGTVEARSIVEPVRKIIKKRNGEIQFWEAECIKVDAANNKILCKSNFENSAVGSGDFSLEYDYLVIAVGAQVNTFNTPGVMENCHFLKDLEDAQQLRRSVIDCFEKAVLPNLTEEERRINLHFVVVGGGPTGVEFAAELHDFLQEDLVNIYPMVKDLVKITVIQSGDHILNMFDERISSFAEQKFQRDGIEVQTGCRVISVSDKEITMKVKPKGEVCSVPHGLVVWSTGVSTRPVVRDFMEQVGQANRRVLATDEWLRVKGSENVYALGDCATIDQRKIMEDIGAIFKAADKDNSGTLTVQEFQDVMDDVLIRYPQLGLYLRNKHLRDVADLLKDPEGICLSSSGWRLLKWESVAFAVRNGASTVWRRANIILKVLDVLEVLGVISSDLLRTNILGNLLLWEESRLLQNCLEIVFPWVTAPSGSGILYMQASKLAGVRGCWWSPIGLGDSFLEEIQAVFEALNWCLPGGRHTDCAVIGREHLIMYHL
ncbi:external alternative NAD(P)H-ubiquinone oxidoreductase B1, mitochondrial isoform X2 [Jatropha curcas]|uniref:external alternative NAD(P)H-ubiquinone oxidoreductase B1, mitochondrial isoform X2 n=1 Tax=Jatropha curcas TaxID=180498 RepID=UPI0009D70B0A|nr:external alternative NAD(P)H-ubiquinone oxidoreductase B1, mitochondrial isoform X2 [Jatropha curcas]